MNAVAWQICSKSCVPLKSRINKRLCKHANRTAGARGGTYGFMTWITVKRQVSKSFIQPLVLLLLGHYERSQIKKLCEKKNCTVEISTPTVSKSVSWSLKLGGHMFCRKRETAKFPIWFVQQRLSLMAFTSPLLAFPVHLIIFLMDTNT